MVDEEMVAEDEARRRGFEMLGEALAAMLRATRGLQQSSARANAAAAELDVAAQRLLTALTPLAPPLYV